MWTPSRKHWTIPIWTDGPTCCWPSCASQTLICAASFSLRAMHGANSVVSFCGICVTLDSAVDSTIWNWWSTMNCKRCSICWSWVRNMRMNKHFCGRSLMVVHPRRRWRFCARPFSMAFCVIHFWKCCAMRPFHDWNKRPYTSEVIFMLMNWSNDIYIFWLVLKRRKSCGWLSNKRRRLWPNVWTGSVDFVGVSKSVWLQKVSRACHGTVCICWGWNWRCFWVVKCYLFFFLEYNFGTMEIVRSVTEWTTFLGHLLQTNESRFNVSM